MFKALHGVDHKKNHSSKLAGITMYSLNSFGRSVVAVLVSSHHKQIKVQNLSWTFCYKDTK